MILTLVVDNQITVTPPLKLIINNCLIFCLLLSMVRLTVFFDPFIKPQFSQIILNDYVELVDYFGNLLWTSAFWSVFIGFITDWAATKINKPLIDAKIIIVHLSILVGNLCNLITFGLQWRKTIEMARSAAFFYNVYRSLLYTLAAVYLRCQYPSQVFGTLMGFSRIVMGLSSVINIGLVEVLTAHSVYGYMYIILILGILQLVTLSFPLYSLYIKLKK